MANTKEQDLSNLHQVIQAYVKHKDLKIEEVDEWVNRYYAKWLWGSSRSLVTTGWHFVQAQHIETSLPAHVEIKRYKCAKLCEHCLEERHDFTEIKKINRCVRCTERIWDKLMKLM